MTQRVALAALTAVEGAHAYSAFNPSIFTIRHFRDRTTERDVRAGEVLGSAFTLALGLIVSLIVNDWLPLAFAAGVVVVMVSVYEWALQS